MQQALRPCAAVIDPSLSEPYEVVKPYLYPQANLDQEPDFSARVPVSYVNTLPARVTCNDYQWYNFDQMFRRFCTIRGEQYAYHEYIEKYIKEDQRTGFRLHAPLRHSSRQFCYRKVQQSQGQICVQKKRA
jgi:hypothetical protein